MPNNVFFHVSDNEKLNFSQLYAKDVMYTINTDYRGNERAVITRVLK